MPDPIPSVPAGAKHAYRLEDGLTRIETAVDSLAEPRRHAQDELDAALREWRLLTPHHHLFTYEEEVNYLNTEWKQYRQACEAMQERLATRPKRRVGRNHSGGQTDSAQLDRLRAQLAAVEVRLKVLESQRKASGVVDVLPSDVAFAGKNLRSAQEWLSTLDAELDDLMTLRSQLAPEKAA